MKNRKSLKFNSDKMYNDFYNMILDVANKATDDFWSEVKSGLKFSSDTEMDKAKSELKGHITARVIFNALAILESYGKGSKMDKSNPALKDYFDSKLKNRLRQSYDIVGREYGPYTDIFGREVTSPGTMPGSDLEWLFPPKDPTNVIRDSENRLKQGGRINRLLNDKIKLFFKNSSKYFTYG